MSAHLLVAASGGIATITLNRPEVHNAFDDRLITELTTVLARLAADAKVRVVVIAASGDNFSAGADINWMQRSANASAAQNLHDGLALATMLSALDSLNKPTIARVHGAAYGGGIGLVACCDIAIAARDATFSFPEVWLGLVPSVISPYVLAAIGERYARRYFLTAERFDAAEAYRIGLVHDLVERDALDATISALCAHLLRGGPKALAAAKHLIASLAGRNADPTLAEKTARRIATLRASAEGGEGIAAFLGKRSPAWLKKPHNPRKKAG